MRAIAGRVAAVIVGFLVAWLAGSVGVEVSEGAQHALTEGITWLGMGIWLLVYPIVHKLINRRLAPGDTAT